MAAQGPADYNVTAELQPFGPRKHLFNRDIIRKVIGAFWRANLTRLREHRLMPKSLVPQERTARSKTDMGCWSKEGSIDTVPVVNVKN